MAVDIQEGKVCGVITNLNGYYSCKALVIATGTTLGGRIFVGEAHYDSGPDGTHAATALTKCLVEQGFTLRRFKTGIRPAFTTAASTLPSWSVSPATRMRNCSLSAF